MYRRRFKRTVSYLACVMLAATGLVLATPAGPAAAAPALPTGFVFRDQASGQGPGNLTDFAYLPDDTVLTVGKNGTVSWLGPSAVPKTLAVLPVLNTGDVGLTGIEPAADYATSKQIYLARAIATPTGFVQRVSRWQVTGDLGPSGLSGEQIVLELPGDIPLHGISGLIADDDGTLWISLGDSADTGYSDPRALRALDLNSLYGKILHVSATGAGVPGNPYYDPAAPDSVRSRVYASGFRSPFRMSKDPDSGKLLVGDVGWNGWEEIDYVQPGQSYSWPCWEGKTPTPGFAAMAQCAGVPNNSPLWMYQHGSGSNQGNSVTGGIVYTGSSYPEKYRGAYFFGDYVGQRIWALRYDGFGALTEQPETPPFGGGIGGPVKFAPARNGDLVYADILSGNLRRLSYAAGNAAPVAKASSSTDPSTRTVSFDGAESFDFDRENLTYSWNFGDGGTATGVTASHTYAPGTDRFTATLTVTDPLGGTGSTEFAVVPSNHSPVLQLSAPATNTFAVDQQISLSATGADQEDGALTVDWTTSVVHCPDAATCHAHPGPPGTGADITMPFTDHADSRVELTATVTDSEGVKAATTYVAKPREHLLKLTSNVPATLQIPAEGGASSGMVTEGATLDVVASAFSADGSSPFGSWENGSLSTSRQLTMGAADTTLNAIFTTPIDARYAAGPVIGQLLGAPTAQEVTDVGMHYRNYERGRMYWTPATGAKFIFGGIFAKYLTMGAHNGFGVPVTDELSTADGIGRFNHFTNRGSIYWTPSTGAQSTCCQIREVWQALGSETGLGYPTTSELTTPDGVGRYNHYTNNGSIYWTPWTGAQSTCCQIRDKWASMGWEFGLGYPTTSEQSTPDGKARYNHYTNRGSIYWRPETGAQSTCCQIRERWAALGWEFSYLGHLKSSEYSIPGGRRSDFQYGYITWNAATGQVQDRRY
ncbi:PQQ-dependent sugar dehydrogenase [Amycolatopsis nigrescens]|uniref:PQQ-dependent sugar dehydrogenase n=1 Tax=Amycolatopsis nigrescens TaxID=381445 RepID=UPI00039A31AA|nr:PQQ-dependent sugar dehydrogenase [Amycolatopsis nigrescens]